MHTESQLLAEFPAENESLKSKMDLIEDAAKSVGYICFSTS